MLILHKNNPGAVFDFGTSIAEREGIKIVSQHSINTFRRSSK